jgi:hypothetical protein
MQIVSGFERRRKFFATLHEDTKDQREQGAPSASVHVVWSCHQAFSSMKIESGLPAKIDRVTRHDLKKAQPMQIVSGLPAKIDRVTRHDLN